MANLSILLTDPCTKFDSSRRVDAFSSDADPLPAPWVAMQQMKPISSLGGRVRCAWVGHGPPIYYGGMLHTVAGVLGDQSVQATVVQLGWDSFGPILRGDPDGSGYLCHFGYWGMATTTISTRFG